MNTKAVIKAWKSGQFTEEDMVKSIFKSHLEFRRFLNDNAIDMPAEHPLGLKQEIQNECEHQVDKRYLNVKWIARNYGISGGQVVTYKYGNFSNTTSTTNREAVESMLAQGHTDREISQVLGITVEAVRYYQPDKPRTKYKRLNTPEETWEKLYQEYDTGKFSVAELARLYKVHRTTLIARLKRREQNA